MPTLTNSIQLNISSDISPVSSSVYHKRIQLSENNKSHIYSILAYGSLQENWDLYGAKKPSRGAITKAIKFICVELSNRKQEVFFTAPTPDGDILIELKNDNSIIEFLFSEETDDKIIASDDNVLYAECILNETTLKSYINWLYR